MPWAAAAAVAGAVITSSAAGDAADAQSESAANADATQRYMYDKTRADNAPFLANGTAASNRLAYLLGLNPTGSTGGATGSNALTRDQIRSELLSQYTTQPETGGVLNPWGVFATPILDSEGVTVGWNPARQSSVDEAGLNAAVDARLAKQQQEQDATQATAQNDPAFGSLMRRFSASDLNADPVYQSGLQFGLSEGEKGLNHQAAASGSLLSGATLKALTRYGNDYASTKAEGAYNRYNTDQTNQFNRLSGISGGGQTASNLVSSAGQNMANNISANQIGVGNARASSYIAGANGVNNAIGAGVNAYQQNQLMNSLFPKNSMAGYSEPAGGFYPYGGSGYDVGNMS
jgi:hypothetical protein